MRFREMSGGQKIISFVGFFFLFSFVLRRKGDQEFGFQYVKFELLAFQIVVE